jgi:zinc/manganese transport system permease protein
MSLEAISIILPAFCAGLLIIATHVPLGIEVMKRGIIFIDLAVAQIAGLGVIVATLFFHVEEYPFITQIMAFIFAISSAYGFKLCEKYLPDVQEAIIGSVYVFASSAALLLLANHPHGAEEVENLLSGQLLWVSWKNIVTSMLVYGLLCLLIFKKNILKKYFYFIFAIAITVSVQLAGVYLVFASLILPAIFVTIGGIKSKVLIGYIVSVLSLIMGLVISLVTDFPTGPVLVCVLFLLTTLLSVIFYVLKKKSKIKT